MTDNPKVYIGFETHWCAKHLEPLRENWPMGAGLAMMRLFETVVADSRIIAAAPKDAQGKAKTDSLNAVLIEYSPLCCFVGEEAMRKIYHEIGRTHPDE